MARLLTLGFELRSVTAGVEFDTVTGSPTISTGIKRSGGASLRCNTSSAAAWIQHRVRADSTVRIYSRFYLYIATAPTGTIKIAGYSDGTGYGWKLQLKSDSTLQVVNDDDGDVGSPSASLSASTWYRIEIDYDDASGDLVYAYVDGVAFVSGVAGSNVDGGGVFDFGVCTSGTADIYFDDIAVNDTTGSYQTGLPGAGSIICIRPNATGDANSFGTQVGGTSGAANNYTRVNQTPPDDVTSYNGSNTANQEDLYNCDASGIGASDTVNVVAIGWRYRRSASGTGPGVKLECMKTTGGTKKQGSAIVPNSTTWKTNQNAVPKTSPIVMYLDPNDTVAWTQATLDTMQIGMLNTQTTTPRCDVSSVWAMVDYTPLAGTLYLQSVIGGLIISGAVSILHFYYHAVAVVGGLIVSGVLTRAARLRKSIAGGFVVSGAVSKLNRFVKMVAGGLVSSGAVLRTTLHMILAAAEIALSGTISISRRFSKDLIGSFALVGLVLPTGLYGKVLTGGLVLSSVASCLNSFNKLLASSLTLSGMVSRAALYYIITTGGLVLSGTVTLFRMYYRLLTGELLMSGTLLTLGLYEILLIGGIAFKRFITRWIWFMVQFLSNRMTQMDGRVSIRVEEEEP